MEYWSIEVLRAAAYRDRRLPCLRWRFFPSMMRDIAPLGCSLRLNVQTVFLILSHADRCVLRDRCARRFCCLSAVQILKLLLRNFMHLEVITRQPRDLTGSGEGRDRTLVHRDRLRLGIAFAAGFVVAIELRGGGKRAHVGYVLR